MIVEQLSLVDFRNYAVADVTLGAGANVFVGRNGQGKTNLAEAIGYFATLGSHRVSQDAPMVRDGSDAAIVRMRLAYGERRVLLEAQLNRSGSNKARVNGSAVRTAELPRYAQVVLFAPEDLQIVRSDPSARRRFADQLLIQRSPRMAGVLGDYDRVLKQRTALLKSARARGIRGDALSTLEVWDDKLIQLGTEVIRARLALADALAAPVAQAYAAIAGADHRPELEWTLSIDGTDAEDDDAPSPIPELVEGSPTRTPQAIEAQFRTALASRRSAELDTDRRSRLAGLVEGYEQVVVTAAVEEDVPEALRARTVRVVAGTIVAEPVEHEPVEPESVEHESVAHETTDHEPVPHE